MNNKRITETLKNIANFILFCGGMMIISIILTKYIYNKGNTNIYDSLAVYNKINEIKSEPDNSLQVLFYGDSECYSSFYPKILSSEFNISSYVCATAAQQICDTYAIFKENIKTQKPDIIVLETNCLYRQIKTNKTDKDIVMKLLTNHFSMFAYHSDWKIMAKKIMPPKNVQNKRKNRGFVVRKNVIPYKGKKYMKPTGKSRVLPKDNIVYLNKIKSLCESNNIELLLVSTPSPKNWSYKKHNGIYNWASTNSVTYIDLNLEKELNINWKKDTKDGGDHLNLSGANKVTRYLGNYMKTYYFKK